MSKIAKFESDFLKTSEDTPQSLDYEQSLFFLNPSSKTPETRKWPRAWVKARDGRGTTFSVCRPRFSRNGLLQDPAIVYYFLSFFY